MFKQFFLWFLIIILIFVRYLTTLPVFGEGDKVKITTAVYQDPVVYPNSQYLRISGLKIYLPNYPQVNYGDKVVLEGVVRGGILQDAKIISLTPGGFLTFFRNKLIDFYQQSLPQPMSGLLGGIILGAKGPIDKDFYELTKTAGVAHVVVASGTNVTFVVAFLSSLAFVFLPRRRAIPFVMVGIILYLFISGFDAPLIRAAIMSGTAFLAQETGRVSVAWRIFFLTAGVMLIVNPGWIADIGFLLSFASTGAIMLFQKRIDNFIKRIPRLIRGDLATTISAQIGVTPILALTFGQFNILSPLINLLVLWTVPPLMIIGSVGGIAGLIFEPAGKLILYLGYPLLWWFVRIVQSA